MKEAGLWKLPGFELAPQTCEANGVRISSEKELLSVASPSKLPSILIDPGIPIDIQVFL